MPMLDAFIPRDALTPEAERRLLGRLTDLLLQHEGVDPTNERGRSLAWAFVHRPEVFVAGAAATAPRYRLIASVPEGQYDDERRSAVVASMTEAVLDAEEGTHPRDSDRVWVITNEIPDGNWGARGRIFHLTDIAAFVLGETARPLAAAKLARRRSATAAAVLAAAQERDETKAR
jgi:phenylpyruvate tautomerase PptA (4-oxalocrotonate tautomerase family)